MSRVRSGVGDVVRLRRAGGRVPPVSGRATVIVLVLCCAAIVTLVPLVLRLPTWIEIELALLGCWLVFGAMLTALLHRGARVADDWDRAASADAPVPAGEVAIPDGPSILSRWIRLDASRGAGTFVLAVVVAAVALLLAAIVFVLVELVFPALFLVVYVLIRSALARVTDDEHGCAGSLPRSIAWGVLWSTLYILPLGLLVALVQVVVAR